MADDKNNPYGEQTTGHLWDDNLCELTNPPPKWWMLALHASWIFVVVYGLIYPMWPVGAGYTKGLTGWTSIGEYKKGVDEIKTVRAKYEDKLAGMTAQQMAADPEIKEYVTKGAGKVLFGDNCAACHGAGGQGNPGFPNLADDDWLYGGDLATLETTIGGGRKGMMPAKGGAQLTAAEIDKLADAIIAGKPAAEPLFAAKGCVGCHGMDGKGMAALGSANLADGIWRFAEADQKGSVVRTIAHGVNDPSDKDTRNAEMPAFGKKLGQAKVRELAVYVHSFGGGK